MARNTAELIIKATDQASAVLERIGRHGSASMGQVGRQAEMAARSMNYLKAAVVSAAAALGAQKAGSWLVGSNAQMEQYTQTLNIVMKSTEKAAETIAWATKFAAQTPFEIPGIIEATVRLQAYGLEAKKYLTDLGDMASAMGKPLMQAVEAVADAQTGELERLKEFGVTKTMLIQQAAAMGKGEIVNAQGQITDLKSLNEALIQIIRDRYSGAMEAQSETLNGMLSNMQDWVGTAGRTLGEGLFEQSKEALAGVMEYLERLTESGKIEEWGKRVGSAAAFAAQHLDKLLMVVAGYSGFKAFQLTSLGAAAALRTFGTVIKATTGAFAEQGDLLGIVSRAANRYRLELALASAQGVTTTGVIARANIALSALSKTMKAHPIGWIVTGIGLAAGAYALYKNRVNEAITAEQEHLNSAKQEAEQAQANVSKISQQLRTLEQLESQYITLVNTSKDVKASDKQMAATKINLANIESELIPIIGQEGMEKIRQAKNTETAYNAEVEALRQKLQAHRDAVEKARSLEFSKTENLIRATEARIQAIEAEKVAYGNLNKANVWHLEKLRDAEYNMAKWSFFPDSVRDAHTRTAHEFQSAINTIIDQSKAPELAKANAELSKARQQLLSLGDIPSVGIGGSLSGLSGGLDSAATAADKANKSLVSLGSTFGTVSDLLGKSSKSNLLEAQNVLQGIVDELRKAEASEAAGKIEEAMTQLPAVMADKAGSAAKVVVGALYEVAAAAQDISSETADKIWNLSQIAMAKIDEKLAESRREWVTNLRDLGKEIGSAVGTGSDEAKTKVSDMIEDITTKAQEFADLGDPVAKELVRVMTLAMSQLPGAVADYTGQAGDELLAVIKDVCVRINKYTGDSSFEIRRNFRDAVREAAKYAEEMRQKVADILARAGEIHADMNERLTEANTSYQESITSVNEKLKKDLVDLRDNHNKNVQSIIDKYKKWIGLFDEAPKRQWISATKMLRNLREQNRQFQDFYAKLNNLSARGVDDALIEELKAMGPTALPYIQAMTRMTDAQLTEYVTLWRQKGAMASDAASGEIEEARQEMLTTEQKMRADAKKELDRLYQEWKKQTAKIKKDTSDKLTDIAKNAKDQGKNFIANLLDGIAAQYPAFKTMIDKIKADMDLGTTGGTGNKTVEQMSEEEIGELVRQIVASKQHLGASYSGNGIVSMFDYAKGEGYDISLAEFLARYGSDSSSWSGSGGSGTTGSGSGGSSGGPGSGGTGAAKEQPKYIFTPEGYRMIGDTAAVWARRFENYGYAVDWDAARGQVIVNGKRFTPLDIDSDDHAWVSLRQVFEAMGRRVEWDSSNGNVNVYHKGGQVSKLGPKEVPIVAEEGELIVPAGYNVVNLEKVFSRGIDRLIKELRELLPVRVEKLQQAENIHIHKQVDLERNNRKLAREILLMAGR